MGVSPLHLAASCGRPELLTLILNSGANINATDKVTSYLHFLTKYKKRITDLSSPLSSPLLKQSGQSALYKVTAENLIPAAQTLLERGADVNLRINVRNLLFEQSHRTPLT